MSYTYLEFQTIETSNLFITINNEYNYSYNSEIYEIFMNQGRNSAPLVIQDKDWWDRVILSEFTLKSIYEFRLCS